MKYRLVSILALSSFAAVGLVHADDDDEGRLKVRLDAVEVQADANTAAITDNANNITDNANAISSNATGVAANANSAAANSTAISANASGIVANAAAIANIPVEATYDYRDYSTDPSIVSKVMAVTGGGRAAGGCTTETRSSVRSNVAGVDITTLTRVRTHVDGFNCGYHQFVFELRADGRYMMSNDLRTPDGAASRVLREIDDGMLMRTTTMQVGRSFGNASGTTNTRGSGVTQASVTQNVTFQGIEDVTVPYNGGTTYTGCMKVHVDRNSTDGLGGQLNMVSWYCPTVGLAKRIDAIGNVMHLTDIVYAP